MSIGIIPARLKSSRFPEKIMTMILGKSVLQRTFEKAIEIKGLKEIAVATDDQRVFDHVCSFGGKAFMTSADHLSGTDRVAEVAAKYYPDVSHIVNIQADEPLLNPCLVDQLIEAHLARPEVGFMTAVQRIEDRNILNSPGVVKCVFDSNGRALYFSRALIPYEHKAQADYYRHIGIYSFTRSFLLQYTQLSSTRLREVEDLEQLKVLEWGLPIHVTIVYGDCGIDVNYPEDLAKVENILCKENISLSQGASSPRLAKA